MIPPGRSRLYFTILTIAAIYYGFVFLYAADDLYDRNVTGTIQFGPAGVFSLVAGIYYGWLTIFRWNKIVPHKNPDAGEKQHGL